MEVSCNGGTRKSSKSLRVTNSMIYVDETYIVNGNLLDHFSFETYSMILGIPHFKKPPYNIMFRIKIAILKIFEDPSFFDKPHIHIAGLISRFQDIPVDWLVFYPHGFVG